MESKQVKKLMEMDLKLINPDVCLEEASKMMNIYGCGFLPIGGENTLEGIISLTF